MFGKCESSDTIAPGVYTIFRTAEECCTSNYPESSSCIPTAPPSASPSLQPEVVETSKPQIAHFPADIIELKPIPISFYNLPYQFVFDEKRRGEMNETVWNLLTSTSVDFNARLVSIDIEDEISSLFSAKDQTLPLILQITVTGTMVLPREIHAAFLNTLHYQLYEISRVLREAWGSDTYTNSVILSIGDAQTTPLPSPNPTTLHVALDVPDNRDGHGGSKSLPILSAVLLAILCAMLCGGLLVWQRRRNKNADMPPSNNDSLFDEEMSDTPSKIAIGLSPHQSVNQTQLIETNAKSFQYSHDDARANKINQTQQRNMSTNFNESRCSQMRFQSMRSNTATNLNESQRSQMSFQSIGTNFNESRRSQMSFQSCGSNMDTNVNESRRSNMADKRSNQSRLGEWSINGERKSQIEPEGEKSFEQSMYFAHGAMDINKLPQIEQNQSDGEPEILYQNTNPESECWKRVQMNQHHVLNRELDESGYDGGNSSFFVAKVESSDDSSHDDDADEDSIEEGNVLGLLYYDGASSASESEARESRKSRRSERTNRSRHSSEKSSSGKSSKNRSTSSRSQKSRRKKARHLKRLEEEEDYNHQHIRDPQGSCEIYPGESQQDYSNVTKPIREDDPSGSIVHANSNSNAVMGQHGTLNENGAGRVGAERSFFSHGSSIKTEDTHHKRFAHSDGSWQEDYDESFNSAGEHTADLNNNPEAKN